MRRYILLFYALFLLNGSIILSQENACSTPVPDHELDILVPVNDDKILTGSFGYRTLLWEMKAGSYFMIDKNSGEVLWEHNKKNVKGVNEKILITDPVILIKSEYENRISYFALDPGSGSEIWEFSLNSKKGISLLLDNNKYSIC